MTGDSPTPQIPQSPQSPQSPQTMHSRVLVIQHEDDCPLGELASALHSSSASARVVKAHEGEEVPTDLEGADALVVLGGGMGPRDDAEHPWLEPTRALLRRAAAEDVPTLAICLGAELAVDALGGATGRAAHPEVGLCSITLTAAGCDDPLLGALRASEDADAESPDMKQRAASSEYARPESVRNVAGSVPAVPVLQWHQDTLAQMPPGVTVLATGPDGAVQAFRVGASFWAVQFHPEVQPGIVQRWAETSSLTPEGRTPDSFAREIEDAQAARSAWARLLDAFAQRIVPSPQNGE